MRFGPPKLKARVLSVLGLQKCWHCARVLQMRLASNWQLHLLSSYVFLSHWEIFTLVWLPSLVRMKKFELFIPWCLENGDIVVGGWSVHRQALGHQQQSFFVLGSSAWMSSAAVYAKSAFPMLKAVWGLIARYHDPCCKQR